LNFTNSPLSEFFTPFPVLGGYLLGDGEEKAFYFSIMAINEGVDEVEVFAKVKMANRANTYDTNKAGHPRAPSAPATGATKRLIESR